MKTFILKLERHDDIISVRDKMGWAKDSRILIVWPEKEGLLHRRLDLVLLLRRAQSLGSPLALVTRDRDVRYYAPRIGIPVFKSLRQAQNRHWRVPHRFRSKGSDEAPSLLEGQERRQVSAFLERPPRETRQLSPSIRVAFFAAGVLSLLAIAATLAPGAQLSLSPRTIVQDVLIDAYSNPEIEAVSLAGAVPSELVSVIVEGRETLTTSGSIRLPDRPAEGKAIFTNLTDQPVDIPSGTVVRPLGERPKRYATLRDSTAPVGAGQTVEVDIRCLTPGGDGNLPANRLAAIEGYLGTQLSVTNLGPIAGGSDRREPAPREIDRTRLAESLFTALEATALREIEKSLDPGDLAIPSTLELLETISESYQPEQEQPADQLVLTWQLEFQARVIRREKLEDLVLSVFDANLPAGYNPLVESLQVEHLNEAVTDDSGQIYWKLHAVRRLQAQISDSQAIRLSLGLAPDLAASRLQASLPLEGPPKITIQPDWWPRLPVLPFRIDVVNQSPDDLAGMKKPGS